MEGSVEGMAKRQGPLRGGLTGLAAACFAGLLALTVLVHLYPAMSWEESLMRGLQGIPLGALDSVFWVYQQIGGPYGLEAEAGLVIIVLALNWRAWRLLAAGAAASGWYFGMVNLVARPRPEVPVVLRVTEHPGGWSYPSGHIILFVYYAVVLMVAVGMKYLPRRWQPAGWVLAGAFVLLGAFSRVYSGAHWPTDVLAGLLIGVGWMSLVLAVRWVSSPVLKRPKATVVEAAKTVAASSPKQAAKEVLAGQPQESAQAWLGLLTIAAAVAFAIVTAAVWVGQSNGMLLPIDLPVTLAVQSFNWGPLVWVFQAINLSAGFYQGALGVAIVLVLFIWERRAGWLMLLSALSSLWDNIIKLVMERPRPTLDLVHILTPAAGWSYPSGHVVFFTWVSTMIAFAVASHLKTRGRMVLWTTAGIVIVLTMLARVWAGDHWPSDVLGGFLLGMGWSAFVMWLPERWLPAPHSGWLRGRAQPA